MYDQYSPGDFSFITNNNKSILEKLYKLIDDLNYWELFEIEPPPQGYMLWDEKRCDELFEKSLFSGAEFGMAMRQMQQIYRLGWTKYVENTIKSIVG